MAALALFAVAACTSKADDAQEQYSIVSNSGSLADKCAKAGEVQQDYLAAHDQPNYEKWKAIADADCAEMAAVGANMPANEAQQERVLINDADNALADAEATLKEGHQRR